MKHPKSVLALMLPLAMLMLLIFYRAPSAHAWQLGWYTTDSVGDYGARDYVYEGGTMTCSSCFIYGATAFTDNGPSGGTWHEIRMDNDKLHGTSAWAEWSSSSCSGGYCEVQLTGCSLSVDTFYMQEMYYDTTWHSWVYYNSGCSGDYYLNWPITADKVNSGGSLDMMESYDTTSSDFASRGAYVFFNTALMYWTGSAWYSSTVWDHQWTAGPSLPNTLGAYYYCSIPYIYIESDYAPPWASGNNPGWAC